MPRSRLRLDLLERRDTPAAGVLDPSFDGDGVVQFYFGEEVNFSGFANDVASLPGNKVLIATRYEKRVESDAAVIRLNADGSFDPGFGTNGVVRLNLGSHEWVPAIAPLPDGGVVLAVNAGLGFAPNFSPADDFALVRLTAAGEPDPSFGANGVAIFDLPSADFGLASITRVVVQPAGRVVALGSKVQTINGSSEEFPVLVGITADGTLDDTFGAQGLRRIDVHHGYANGGKYGLSVRPDGSLVVSGDATPGGLTNTFFVARLTADGNLDPGFDGDGLMTVSGPANLRTTGLAVQVDGKIVVGAESNLGATAVRVLADGGLDTAFGSGGFAGIRIGQSPTQGDVNGIGIGPDGTIVLGVKTDETTALFGYDFAAARFRPDGSPDTTFGTDGLAKVTLEPEVTETVLAAAVQSDGDVLLAGWSAPPNGQTTQLLTVMRLQGGLEPPSDIRLDGDRVPENAPVGTLVGVLTADDPNAGDFFTFSLVPGSGATDNAAFFLIDSHLKTAVPFDFELTPTLSIRVRATDNTGQSFEEVLAVNVGNVNERPTDITLSNSLVPEFAQAGALVGTLSVSDPDAGDSVAFTLLDSAGGRFAIVGGGNLTVARSNRLDFETSPTHTVRVRARDAGGLTFDKTLSITVLDQFEGRVTGQVVNGGRVQRSRVTALTVTFGLPMTVDPAAFTLIRDDGGPLATVGFTTALVGGKTVAVLNFSGAGTEGGSLVDGRYRLTIDPMKVRETATGQPLDGDADGNPGGAYTSSDFHRLFGDVTGDGMVGTADDRIYRAYRARGNARAAAYLRLFDLDASGLVDGADDRQFQARRGRRV